MKILDDLVKASEDLADWILKKSELIPIEMRELFKESLAPILTNLETAIKAAKEKSSDPDTVKLFCHNEKCSAKGSYITRGSTTAKSSVFICDMCNQVMKQ